MADFSITLKKQYKSLSPFSWDNIPNFAVVTGLNGAGKSHLLEMIARDCQAIGDNSNRGRDTPAPEVTIRGIATGSGKVLYAPIERNVDFSETVTIEDIEKRIKEIYDHPFRSKSGQTSQWRRAGTLYEGFRVPSSPLNPDVEDAVRPPLPEFRRRLTAPIIANAHLAGRTPNLAMLFFAHALLHANLLSEGKTADEARKLLGTPPWQRLNQIFETAGLHLRAESPSAPKPHIFSEQHSFTLMLRDTRTGSRILPNSLSSGEKALCSLLFLEYSTTVRESQYSLILLDEPDAHLHADFIARYLNVIKVITSQSCRVVMTTHSPMTVALAPEESLYTLRGPQTGAPVPTSRFSALAALLEGVPTVSVIADQNRQIFVESQHDANAYTAFYRAILTAKDEKYRRYLRSDVSLTFISSGSGGSGSCNQVRDVVSALKQNPFVGGLIDWDLKNVPSERVLVHGENERFSIENYLFEPLSLASFLLYERIELGLPISRITTFPEFLAADEHALRLLAAEVAAKLLQQINILREEVAQVDAKFEPQRDACIAAARNVLSERLGRFEDNGQTTSVTFLSGKTVIVPSWPLLMRGHDLETLAVLAFKPLRRFSGKADQLKMEVVKKVFAQHPGMIPENLAITIGRLQQLSGKEVDRESSAA